MLILLFPFLKELQAFLQRKPQHTEILANSFLICKDLLDEEILLTICGQGKVQAALAAQSFSHSYPGCKLMLLGSATAIDPRLAVGDIIIARQCWEWDFGQESVRVSLPKIPRFDSKWAMELEANDQLTSSRNNGDFQFGATFSGDRNVFDPELKSRLWEASRISGLALAWEGAGFHRFLKMSQYRGLEIRCITETKNEFEIDFKTLESRMSESLSKIRNLVSLLRDTDKDDVL